MASPDRSRLEADATTAKLLEAILNAKTKEDFTTSVSETLRVSFNDVSAAAWRAGLEELASELEDGLRRAHALGLHVHQGCVGVVDLIMAIRVKAQRPRQAKGPSDA